jgi:hypothetical protein
MRSKRTFAIDQNTPIWEISRSMPIFRSGHTTSNHHRPDSSESRLSRLHMTVFGSRPCRSFHRAERASLAYHEVKHMLLE